MIIAFKQYNVYGTSMLRSQVIWHSLKSVNICDVFCIYYNNSTADRKPFYPRVFKGIDYNFPMV